MLGKDQRAIHIEVCHLIYKTLLTEIKDILMCDPVLAYELCMIAKQRCFEGIVLYILQDLLLFIEYFSQPKNSTGSLPLNKILKN